MLITLCALFQLLRKGKERHCQRMKSKTVGSANGTGGGGGGCSGGGAGRVMFMLLRLSHHVRALFLLLGRGKYGTVNA